MRWTSTQKWDSFLERTFLLQLHHYANIIESPLGPINLPKIRAYRLLENIDGRLILCGIDRRTIFSYKFCSRLDTVESNLKAQVQSALHPLISFSKKKRKKEWSRKANEPSTLESPQVFNWYIHTGQKISRIFSGTFHQTSPALSVKSHWIPPPLHASRNPPPMFFHSRPRTTACNFKNPE